MTRPGTVEEFVAYLDECDALSRSDSAVSVERAKEASGYLKGIKASRYFKQNLSMRTAGVLGRALAGVGQRDEARKVFKAALEISASTTERASLAIRLARFYTEEREWSSAISESELAVQHFCNHRPRHECDLRSPAGALTARGSVYFSAMIAEAAFPVEVDLVSCAENDYRAALLCSSHHTEYSAIAATASLACLALRVWWSSGQGKISPAKIAKEMKRICRLLTRKGIRYHSRAHAKARWLYSIASAEAYGSLNRSDENRLERALLDLLDLGAIKDAAMLVLDLGYLYLRDGRFDDLLAVTDTVLLHSNVADLPPEWRQALAVWKEAVKQRQFSVAISATFKTIRGFSVNWEGSQGIKIPESRYGDRSDTIGF
jgi:tetratricopeptide (TPR) repeat protein